MSQAEAIGKCVVEALARLERSGCPEDAICQHLGVYAGCVDGITVGVSPRDEYTLVTIYHSLHGYPAATHAERAQAVATATGADIVETWNGEEGNDGISVVIARPCPAALATAIANYRKLPNVFKLSDEESQRFESFRKWFHG